MIHFHENSREIIPRKCSMIIIDHALVEEIFTPNSRTGYIVISYAVPGDNNMISIQFLKLNVGWDTILINHLGESISMCSIRNEMILHAHISPEITESNPPQTKAYRILVQTKPTTVHYR